MSQPSIFILAGECSGDMYGAEIIPYLRDALSGIEISGVGGPRMRACGIDISLPMEDLQVMGLTAVIAALPRLCNRFYHVKRDILRRNPQAVLFIDFPGFNLRMAKALRSAGYKGKLFHYIAPTVWAHGKKRIQTLSNTLDCLYTIFPFEKQYFAHTDLKVEFVGNPLIDLIDQYRYVERWKEKHGIQPGKKIVSLFPGSRHSVIKENLPKQLASAVQLQKSQSNLHFVLPVAMESLRGTIQSLIDSSEINPTLIPGAERYDAMRHSSLAIAASGTTNLELALHAIPTVVVYHVSLLNAFFVRCILGLNLKYYSLPNIILEKEVFPELLYKDFTVDATVKQALELLENTARRQSCIDDCSGIRSMLSQSNASLSIARSIETYLTGRLN